MSLLSTLNRYIHFILIAAFLLISGISRAQVKVLLGTIKDQHSAEPVPFASVRFRVSGNGRLADSSGGFAFRFSSWKADTLEITSVGYQDYLLLVNPSVIKGDTLK